MANGLTFWDYSELSELTEIALGSVAARSSDDTVIRVFNISDDYQANDVALQFTGGVSDQLMISLDGEVFTASVVVGDIAAGAASAPVSIRRITPSTAAAQPYSAVLQATVSAWVPMNYGLDDPANPPLDDL